MVQYIETSVILSLVFEDNFYDKAAFIWNKPAEKTSSILTSIEGLIVLRRYFKNQRKSLPSNWISKQEKKLKELLSECNLVRVDERIESIITIKKDISDCRSLDGIHVATAIYLKEIFRLPNFIFNSFDNRVIKVAEKLGLKQYTV
ncbi:PIN domain protein [Leptospira weilii serovar Ranarum str. ICFT]|uniref:PIN domain protein n=1 Tax=Leptospira weilii serovar Ranarum str. ICFT TaxID=1218598 RepID=N1WFD3_9LEPT|nr:PIN domain-containing protein [Leptospira weilii]EMY76027.1 PIN domain protein [Leptospira weilii serovar Ranarum str. ICFT]